MSEEPSSDAIKRRSENAEVVIVGLLSVYDWFWISVGVIFLIACGVYWLIG